MRRNDQWKPRFVATFRVEMINGHYDLETLHLYAMNRNAAYQQARRYIKSQGGGMTLVSLSY
jgi:hypothetical protein